ncbi:uncharacterized protein Z520_01050 [Fonsecaea multimorphosa CBS 102226]|uniref:SP-RING-type domain-containing protein n=1 Tax=Fonsecaea multimorphosa CBS 102226 TaxID=1442371 RepID=A0A0D2KGK3_9EURO|nr:uncharacterized protein Z520_01050 [Fonsecaea multimorphosa CBS 102226]KIY02585.1 hypothetical protein Z520_01050 [Fonsecaea multimorphosa CBS 102226]OAL31451.1 hypothetical protein AYO22_01043 [Fonsecaea multimorphosa]
MSRMAGNASRVNPQPTPTKSPRRHGKATPKSLGRQLPRSRPGFPIQPVQPFEDDAEDATIEIASGQGSNSASPLPFSVPSTVTPTVPSTAMRSTQSLEYQVRDAQQEDAGTPLTETSASSLSFSTLIHESSQTVVPENPAGIGRQGEAVPSPKRVPSDGALAMTSEARKGSRNPSRFSKRQVGLSPTLGAMDLPSHPTPPNRTDGLQETRSLVAAGQNGQRDDLAGPSNTRDARAPRARMSTSGEMSAVSSSPVTLPSDIRGSPLFVPMQTQPRLTTLLPDLPSSTRGTGKRNNDTNGSHGRTVRPRADSRRLESSALLPTPQDSPNVSHGTTLGQRLELSLAAIGLCAPEPDQAAGLKYGRIEMLREACQLNDEFFLLTHFICSNSTPSPNWDVIGPLFLTKEHFQTLNSLSAILCSDSELTRDLSQLFMKFPFRMEATTEEAPYASPLLKSVRSCLDVFDAALSTLKARTVQRGFPPAPCELRAEMRLPSPVLQKAIFCHFYSSRADGSSMFREALRLFEQEMERPIEVSISGIAQLHESPSNFKQLMSRWASKYSLLGHGSQGRNSAAGDVTIADKGGSRTSSLQLSTTAARHTTPAPSQIRSPTLLLSSPMVQEPVHPRRYQQTASVQHARQVSRPSLPLAPAPPSKLPNGFRGVSQTAESSQVALDEAHTFTHENEKTAESDGRARVPTFFRFIEDVVVLPECIQADSPTIRWSVPISQDHWARRVTTSARERGVSNCNVQFRLRSIVIEADGREPFTPTQSDFYARTTKWPACAAVSINGVFATTPRRETPGGADLPTDVTDLLREGNNEVEISALFTRPEQLSACMYLMAIEIICVETYDKIKTMLRRIPMGYVVKALLDALKSRKDELEDDDLIQSPFIGIDVIDPLTSKIWKTPVRGKDCRHRECFDLEAFLSSRAGGFDEGGLTRPDQWNCPICRGNARPNMLVIDEFSVHVRKILEENNQLSAHRILFKEGGAWEPILRPSSPRDQSPGMTRTNPVIVMDES